MANFRTVLHSPTVVGLLRAVVFTVGVFGTLVVLDWLMRPGVPFGLIVSMTVGFGIVVLFSEPVQARRKSRR